MSMRHKVSVYVYYMHEKLCDGIAREEDFEKKSASSGGLWKNVRVVEIWRYQFDAADFGQRVMTNDYTMLKILS